MFKGAEIRELFLKYFTDKQHTLVPSSSLVPDNPTVLLTTAGMLQFMPIYLGYEKPPYDPPRAVSCQKCARAGGKDSDIENVGRTPRHHTFFEMLGNFAFGDYYKKEIIPWAWEFVTQWLKLDPERLWVTVYEQDDEAFEIWAKIVPAQKILRKGKKDNFWGPPGATGSCGPCSEIHYDLGENLKCSPDCGIDTCECDRWVEIWNLVFTELFKDEEGNFTPLDKKNVDTGMGLERITMVCQGKGSTFETDLLRPILAKVGQMSKIEYGAAAKTDVSLRIITDHARCVTFLINDGVVPGNEGRSYVLRMILRRALRHGKILGLELPFLYKLVGTVVNEYKTAYPELGVNQDKITSVIKAEEERFNQTLERGYKLLEELLADDINGEDAFKLYDTYGFPLELTKEIAAESGKKVDETGYHKAMQEQKDRAKAAAQKISLTDDLKYVTIEEKFGPTQFTGYTDTETDAKIVATVEGEDYTDIVLDKTPFYAESGGQVGDTGFIGNAQVLNTFKVGKLFVHRVDDANIGGAVKAQIDTGRREKIRLNHTAAHLLQAALIKVLGDEVKQAGSHVNAERTRFDFSFARAMTREEIAQTETILNDWVAAGLDVCTTQMSIEDAKKSGAIALFGEKYDDTVRVVAVDTVSKELCGGTHANNTRDIGLIKIAKESAIAAGTRRIELVTGDEARRFVELTKEKEAAGQAAQLERERQKELARAQAAQDREKFAALASDAQNGVLIARVDGGDLKVGVETLLKTLDLVVLASNSSVAAAVSEKFIQKGFNAGAIVSEIAKATGANGGGRPNFAQGGIKDVSKLEEILNVIKNRTIGA